MIGGGPLRVPQPIDRQVSTRPDQQQISRQSDALRQRVVENTHVPITTPSYRRPDEDNVKKPKRWWVIPVIVLGLMLVATLGWLYLNSSKALDSTISKDKFQAVFFTSGQVYFGKLSFINNDYLELRDVHYIQSNGDASTETDADKPESTPTGAGMKLIKLGDEIHGPEDKMIINRDQVLFYENLKQDSKVSELIKSYQPGSK